MEVVETPALSGLFVFTQSSLGVWYHFVRIFPSNAGVMVLFVIVIVGFVEMWAVCGQKERGGGRGGG